LALVDEVFGDQAPVYQDDQITVYHTGGQPVGSPFLVLGEGWGERRGRHGRSERSLEAEATLGIVAPAGGETRLVFSAFSQDGTRSLGLLLNGERVGEYEIGPHQSEMETSPLSLDEGLNWLRLLDMGRGEPAIVLTSLDLRGDN
jgi:hypothetical protein